MRKDILLLTLSLALNLALGWLLLTGVRSLPSAPAKSITPVGVPASLPAAAPDAEVWQRLQTPTATDLVARLRAAGFPTDVIRAILSARFSEELYTQLKALDPEVSRRPFWKSSQQNPRVWATMSRMQREQEKQMRTLLGEQDDPMQLLSQALTGGRVDGLAPEKAAAVVEVLRDFDQKRAELLADPSSTLNREARAALEREQRAALARLLTPRELEEFDLRNSALATSMRSELAAFDPTEDEFRAIFRLKNEFTQQYDSSVASGATAAQIRARQEAARRLTEQIQAALGPVRGEEYARKADSTYVQTSRILERLQQPPANVDAVMTVGRDIAARARSLEADRAISEAVRAAQKAALYEEASRRLTPLLGGSSGFEVYRQYGGIWLQAIKPNPPSPIPAAAPPRR